MKLSVGLLLLVSASLSACQGEETSEAQRAFQKGEDPRKFNKVITNRLDRKVTSGALAKVPWADTYWPSSIGGIAARWRAQKPRPVDSELVGWKKVRDQKMTAEQIEKLSPAEKFGLAMGEEQPVFAKKILTDNLQSSAEWMGYCNAWSIASLQYDEPAPVKMSKNGVEIRFGSSDVKAMLIYNAYLAQKKVNSVGGAFLGACSVQGINCAQGGLNAAGLHLILQEKMGKKKSGLILDFSPGSEKWNHPVYSYSSQELASDQAARDAVRPGATQPELVFYRTKINYRIETNPQPQKVGSSGHSKSIDVCYFIEINKKGDVTGGEYLQNIPGLQSRFPGCQSTSSLPDYAWYKDDVPFDAALPGLSALYNSSLGR